MANGKPRIAIVGFGEAVLGLAVSGANSTVSMFSGGGGAGGGSAGGGQGGALVSSEGWAAQGARALADAGKALAQKVQAALTK